VRGRWVVGVILVLAALVLGGPVLLLRHVVSQARECFAGIEPSPAAALPDCGVRRGWLEPLLPLPWVGLPAQRLQEELTARMAVVRYIDAAVGQPNAATRQERFAALSAAHGEVQRGTQRLRLDELGPPLPLPEPGVLAQHVGDRQSLIAHGKVWRRHHVQRHAIRAALLEAQLPRAIELSRHYWDTDNDELRLLLAASACLEGDWERGMNRAAAIEKDRAERRTANFGTNFGAARVIVEACAAGGGLEPPPTPSYGHAGDWDHRARLLVLRMAGLRAPARCDWVGQAQRCWQLPYVTDHVEQIRRLLLAEDQTTHRLELLASIVEALSSPGAVVSLVQPRPTLSPVADELPLLAADWVARRADQPLVAPERYQAAARHLDGLIEEGDDAGADHQAVLRQLAAALRVKGAIGHVLRGDPHPGDLDQVVWASLGPGPWEPLVRANLALVGGQRGEARRLLGDQGAGSGRVAAAAALTLAELLLPDRAPAVTAGLAALKAASAVEAPGLEARARWLLTALGEAAATRRVPPMLRPVWLGRADTASSPTLRDERSLRRLSRWDDWLAQPPAERRPARYALFRQRGDAPTALTPFLHAAGQLAPEPAGVEPWLDAVLAHDVERFGVLSYAFARWRAAAWRGDEEAARTWWRRFAGSSRLASRPQTAELFQQLGL